MTDALAHLGVTAHGIDGGAYDNVAGLAMRHGTAVPRLFCLCGYTTAMDAWSWEDAGADLDDHLRKANDELMLSMDT